MWLDTLRREVSYATRSLAQLNVAVVLRTDG